MINKRSKMVNQLMGNIRIHQGYLNISCWMRNCRCKLNLNSAIIVGIHRVKALRIISPAPSASNRKYLVHDMKHLWWSFQLNPNVIKAQNWNLILNSISLCSLTLLFHLYLFVQESITFMEITVIDYRIFLTLCAFYQADPISHSCLDMVIPVEVQTQIV